MFSHKPLVFISHSAADGDVAKRLKAKLELATSRAVTFFLSCDRDSLPAGDFWPSTITEALESTDIMFVLLSYNSEGSQWVPFEAGYAAGGKKPVIPILLPGYPKERLRPPLQLRQYIAIDSVEALGNIVERLNMLLPARFETSFSVSEFEAIFGPSAFSFTERPTLEALPLYSREELYGEITKLIKASSKPVRIRATSTLKDLDTGSDAAFDEYIVEIATKLGEAARRGFAADYTLVMSFAPDAEGMPPLDRQRSIRNRQQTFEKAGAGNRINILQTPEHWRMDVLLIGEEHLIIGFPSDINDSHLHHGIRISGPEFVSYVSQWFDLYVRPDAKQVNRLTLKVEERKA